MRWKSEREMHVVVERKVRKRMRRATGEAGAGWCSRILGVARYERM